MTRLAAQILKSLRDEDGKQLKRLAELIVDGVLDSPVGQLVDVDLVLGALDAAFDQRVSEEVIERYLKPAARREHTRARDSKEPVEAFLPANQVNALLDIIRRPFPVDPKIINDLVEQKAVRSMLGAIVQEAIQAFVTRAPIPGLSLAVGVVGNLSRRLDQHVGDFLDKSMARLTRRLAELALSETGQKLIGEMGAEMARTAMKTPVSFYYDEVAKLPTEELWALLPPVLAHNLARSGIRQAISGEVEAFLRRDGRVSAREFLDELGILDRVRQLAMGQAHRMARRVIDQPGFETWLEQLINRTAVS
jgi:hypothetical protein